jgi:hypothetical protein
MNKPTNFNDLLELQRVLDENIEKNRNNGFVPRERKDLDIILAIDDEFQEWLRELPYEYNFKTWKQKEYNREKELEELTDILFFFLQRCNSKTRKKYNNTYLECCEKSYIETIFNTIGEVEEDKYFIINLNEAIERFKYDLHRGAVGFAFFNYIRCVCIRKFTKEDLLNTYWEKWQKNMTRINKDWILEGK